MEAGMRRILHKLEADGAFVGRPWLRRKAQSYFLYDSAQIHREAGHFGSALTRIVRALLLYPLPFHDADSPKPIRRGRQLLGILRSCVTGRRVDWYPRPAPAGAAR